MPEVDIKDALVLKLLKLLDDGDPDVALRAAHLLMELRRDG